MIKIRKARSIEMEEILRVANESFRPEREEGFDFQTVMPKAYKKGIDSSHYHTLLLQDDEILALSGNLPSMITIGGETYPFAIVGTVSTLPAYRKNGYMKQLMEEIEKDDRKNGLVFSALSGLRKRYNRYGYEKCTTSYRFQIESYCLREYPPLPDLTLRIAKEDDLSVLYDLYQSTQPFVARPKNTFFDCLSFSRSFLYAVEKAGKIVGYFNLSERKNGVYEIVLQEIALLPHVFSTLFQMQGCTSLNVYVNALNRSLLSALDEFAEGKALCDEIHFKVYDMSRFLQMLLALNAPYLPQSAEERICIDGKTYCLVCKNGQCEVKTEGESNAPSYTAAQFLRFAIGDGNHTLCDGSAIFPLRFGINEADMF